MSDTVVEPYNVLNFKPLLKMNEELLINLPQKHNVRKYCKMKFSS